MRVWWLVIAFLLVACGGQRRGAKATAAGLQQAAFEIEGMTCGSCNVTVKIAAERVDGVTAARASHAEKRAWVTFDGARTNSDVIARAITAAGYRATPVGSRLTR